jgi:hypothetical protein
MMILFHRRTPRGGAEVICNKQELMVLKRALGMLCNDEMETVQRTGKASTARLDTATAMYKGIESYLNDVYRKEGAR